MIKFGLDFGTTNSSISVSFDGKNSQIIEVDKNALDSRVVRSMLYFDHRELVYGPNVKPGQLETQNFSIGDIEYKGEQTYLIGQSAIDKYILENRNRKPGIKRKIFTGRWIKIQYGEGSSGDPMPEYYEEIDYGTGRLIQALKSSLRTFYKGTTIFGKYYTVEEMIGIFVKKFKDTTEKETGEIVEEITIGRPVHFSNVATIDQKAQDRLAVAMKSAGFKKLKFQFEPVAAAKQFVSKTEGEKEIVFVFDFGGGTLDTALVESGKNFKVLATDGVYIGGDLLNADIMQAKLWNYFGASDSWGDQSLPVPLYIYQALNSWHSIPSLNNPDNMELLKNIAYKHSDPQALERLLYLIKTNVGFEIYEAIEKAKKQLSENLESRIIYQDGPINLDLKITRDEFEIIINSRVEDVKEIIFKTLEKAGVKPNEVDKVLRTGGSSLIPVFADMLEEIFGKEKITLFETFTSIAAGLALD
ncbi:MAG: Hsp70 family protein [Candidatus Daviesbacteria bacterium]|nr:Hsp70 family protein [Candidatus Daviesbacteria bacterium]